MAKSPEETMAIMVAAVQPHCDEPVRAAMICSHAGSMSAALTQHLGASSGRVYTSELPNPLMLGVGDQSVYAFAYKPKGFKIKLKKGSEEARWPRQGLRVEADDPGGAVSQFAIVTADGNAYALEATTAMGGDVVLARFLDLLRSTA
jgi:hypothetical protein